MKNKKIFTTRNRFEVVSQTESIEANSTASNPTAEIKNPEANSQQEKMTHLPLPIMVKGIQVQKSDINIPS